MTSTDRRLRVVIIDDEPLIREGVRSILLADAQIEVVGGAGDGRTGVDLVRRQRPDVVLLDIRMPKMDGLAALAEILSTMPKTKVIILTTFGEDRYVERALSSGASGFLLKASDPRELIMGVHAVAEGGAYLSPKIAQRVIIGYRDGSRERLADARQLVARLSEREQEVLAMVGAGYSNAEIGQRLYLVEGTVKSYMSSILTKLEARNRVQAAVIAHQAGLVSQ